jgi:hypothetical protein
MTGIQAWRFAGLGFLALYAHGARRASLGGLLAWAISRDRYHLAMGRARAHPHAELCVESIVIVWNLLGVLDLVTAVSTGALSSALGH